MIPHAIKVGLTAYLAVLLPIYWAEYGVANFLWFCDVALVMTLVGVWQENRRLIGAAALSVVLVDGVWTIDLLIGLASGSTPIGLAAYMFDAKLSPFLRGLSLFHVWFPVLLLWLLHRLGYDRRALRLQVATCWLLLPLAFLLTNGPDGPAGNINQVYGPSATAQTWMHPFLWIALLMIAYPLLVYLPSHLAFLWRFGCRHQICG